MTWKPTTGAWLESGGVCFRVWAPTSQTVEVELLQAHASSCFIPLQPDSDGFFSAHVAGIAPAARYRYRLNGRQTFPDVASRHQPEGVHGPSEVIDPAAFRWSDANWTGLGIRDAIIYELHVGTFTHGGTFEGVMHRLPALRDLGVTAIELMPVADFPGNRNWGYDGVSLFAPARCYGRPDDLRRLIDAAHALGLAVLLDVIYNHLGPDGNYLGAFSPYYFTERHHTPWGPAVNFDGKNSRIVREFFIENALYWLHDFHFDGLRLDATHAIVDDSPCYFLAELSDRVHDAFAGSKRRPLLIAEDGRNLARMIQPVRQGGWGMDAVWADDFHHQLRRALAGDQDGYFQDYTGRAGDIATTIRKGWFYCGQQSVFHGHPRGSEPSGLASEHFVICIQNHDQVGNRACGDRLHHTIEPAAWRAASVLLLCCPQTPLLFMGQEWAAGTPFQFFTDHNESLGKLVTAGRRREFKRFEAFSDALKRETIPDPQALETFLNSRLKWEEREAGLHAASLWLYQTMLRLRQAETALRTTGTTDVQAVGDSALLLRRAPENGAAQINLSVQHPVPIHRPEGDVLVAVQLVGAGSIDIHAAPLATLHSGIVWRLLLSTEDPQYALDPQPITIEGEESAPRITFARPGAVLLKAMPSAAAES
jgi:maltooligosyltrehalose trehalohydrolase